MERGGDRSGQARRPDRKEAALVIQCCDDGDTTGSGFRGRFVGQTGSTSDGRAAAQAIQQCRSPRSEMQEEKQV